MSPGWVCPECGLDYDTISPKDAVAAVRSYPRRYRRQLQGAFRDELREDLVRRRPDPKTWSALEYTAHVADVLDDMADAISRMVRETTPTIDGFDPDQRAVDARYNEQEVDAVLANLEEAAGKLAPVIEGVDAGDWGRTATFPWGERDALTMARNAVHEGYHHLRDTEKVLAAVGAPTTPDDEDE